jgi:glycine betaine/proline transport system substrate-binding protein
MFRSLRSRRGAPLLAGLMAVLTASLAACSGQTSSVGNAADSTDNGKSISIAMVAGWDEDVASTYLWKQLLEQRGYKVDVQQLDIASTFTGVANKQIDLYLDAWLPTTHATYWQKFGPKLQVVNTWYEPASDDLAVPKYVTDVNSIADLKGRSAEFGGRIVGIEAGAGLMRLTKDSVIPKYGLSDYNLVEGSTPAMLAALESAIKAKKPIVVTLWQPHWAFAKFPIKVLKDTDNAFGPPDKAQTIAAKGFNTTHPQLAAWLGKYKLTSDQLGSLELLIQQKGQGHEQEAAKEWIGQNQQLVNSWMNNS